MVQRIDVISHVCVAKPTMCYFPVTRMACSHQEISRIALCCPTASFYIPPGIATNRPNIYTETGLPLGNLGSQELETRSGEMCGPCQVATSEILDNLVRTVDGGATSRYEHCMMSGGLDADSIEIFPENALDDLLSGLEKSMASNGQHYIDSAGQYPDMVNKYPENAWNDFAYVAEEHVIEDTTKDTYEPTGFAQEKPVRLNEETVMEWLNKCDANEEASAGFKYGEDHLRSLSKPSSPMRTTECSSCEPFKYGDAPFDFQAGIYPLPASGSIYPIRNWPAPANLQAYGTIQDEERGALDKII